MINKRKIKEHSKSIQRLIQNPVKAGDGDSFVNSKPLEAVNYYPHRVKEANFSNIFVTSIIDTCTGGNWLSKGIPIVFGLDFTKENVVSPV